MGAVGEKDAPGNEWRTATDWPVKADATPYYLRTAGGLSATAPTEKAASTTFVADPLHPNSIPVRAFPGAKDARDFEKQAEVRTFTSDVLTKPVEWNGKVRAELWVSSTAKDTDFIVRVTDVYPDGRSILLIDYVRRARYREGYEKEVLMEPGKVYPVAFEVLLDGQTPGKRAVGLRVINANGTPVGWVPSIARNLMRTVDMLPLFYGFGLVAGLVDRSSRRFGDMVAGTLVVHVDNPHGHSSAPDVPAVQAPLLLPAAEQGAIVAFAERAKQLTPERQQELANLLPQLTQARGAVAVQRLLGMASSFLGRQ